MMACTLGVFGVLSLLWLFFPLASFNLEGPPSHPTYTVVIIREDRYA
jgi:hypothetical protein